MLRRRENTIFGGRKYAFRKTIYEHNPPIFKNLIQYPLGNFREVVNYFFLPSPASMEYTLYI